jgi:hypothetical protein
MKDDNDEKDKSDSLSHQRKMSGYYFEDPKQERTDS